MTSDASSASATVDTPDSMRGRVCVITGATRGIGRAAALGLAGRGATVVLLARDAVRGAAAVESLRQESSNPDVSLVVADLSSFVSIREGAAEIARRFDAIHVLVNNAGVSLARRATSADGVEMTLAVNHLAPFLLTRLLLAQLQLGAPSRVINVTSAFERWGRVDLEDLERRRRYNGTRAYMQSKLMNVMFTYDLAERIGGVGVSVNCVFPGLVATELLDDRWWWRAPLLRPLWRRIFLTAEEGAQVVINAAASSDTAGPTTTGSCFDRHGREVLTSRRSRDVAMRRQLWELSERMCGLG